jgi:hypothetical protein
MKKIALFFVIFILMSRLVGNANEFDKKKDKCKKCLVAKN